MPSETVVSTLSRLGNLLANSLTSAPPRSAQRPSPRIGSETPDHRLRDIGLMDGRPIPRRDPLRD